MEIEVTKKTNKTIHIDKNKNKGNSTMNSRVNAY